MAAAPIPISVDGLTKRFGAVTALDGIDLSVSDPEIVGLAGPNGSGKTTLIRALLGLIEPTDGRVTLDGTPAGQADRVLRGRIGYMPQRRALYEDLTARGNVGFFARLYGVSDRREAVDRALDLVDLADRAGARLAELSGGMVRRTSLACAIVHRPSLLVLDEPTVGLDPRLRARMWDAFRAWCSRGTTILVSTHYLGEVGRCDRVGFLRAGRLFALDDPSTIRERTRADDLEGAYLALLEEPGRDGSVAPGRREADR